MRGGGRGQGASVEIDAVAGGRKRKMLRRVNGEWKSKTPVKSTRSKKINYAFLSLCFTA